MATRIGEPHLDRHNHEPPLEGELLGLDVSVADRRGKPVCGAKENVRGRPVAERPIG
jgi:hypothetical protein